MQTTAEIRNDAHKAWLLQHKREKQKIRSLQLLLLVFLLAQPQLGASFHHSHRPDTGLDAFSDIGDGIPHFYYILHRGQTQRLHIGENHIGIGYIEYTLRDHSKCNRLPSVPMAEGANMHFLPDPKPVYPAA